MGVEPEKLVLHKTISAIRADSWEAVDRVLLTSAREEKMERGRVVRLDSTVTAALMHEPSDSSLLWDAVRVMVRLLKQAQAWMGDIARAWCDHRRAAKRRWQAIEFTQGRAKRVPLYRELVKIARTTLAYLREAAARLSGSTKPAVALWRAKVGHYEPLVERVIAQSERRVLCGEAVPARDKLVSLFETHADIIVKGSRDVQYGHKLNLTTGRSGLILDVVIEAGNPADSDRLMPMLERRIGAYGAAPRQAAADGGFASRKNLRSTRRHAGCATWPFTRRAASASKTWSAAAGSIASCATSGPGSRPASPASSGPTAWPAAPGAGSTTSRPMSGPRWWPTTSLFSFACDQAEASAALSPSGKLAIASPSSCPRLRRQALSGANCTFDQAKFRKYIHNPDTNIAPNSQPEGKTTRLWTETSLQLRPGVDEVEAQVCAARLEIEWGHVGEQTSRVCWQRPREAEFVTIWIGQVEVALAPFGIAGSRRWREPGGTRTLIEAIHIGHIEDERPHQDLCRSAGWAIRFR